MVTYQWGVFWAELDPVKGSEQSGRRPVLVVSAEEVNQALPIVTILALTAMKPGRRVYPIEVLLTVADTGLPRDSIAMAHQVRAIAKERLREQCGTVNDENVRQQVRVALQRYLDL